MYSSRRKKVTRRKGIYLIPVVLGIGILLFVAHYQYQRVHFQQNTFIQGVDCSHLTIEEAFEKVQEDINQSISQSQITFSFVNDVQYQTTGEQFEMHITFDEEQVLKQLEEFLTSQHDGEKQEEYQYFLPENSIEVNEAKLREYLEELPELQEENMVNPQNAYLKWNEAGLLETVPEVYGSMIDFEEAVSLSLQRLSQREKDVSFKSITDTQPEIFADSLEEEKNLVNSALEITIHFELYDGSVFTLDKEIIRNWVEQDEAGKYFVNVEANLPAFLNELDSAANQANSIFVFQPTGLEAIRLNVPKALRAKVDVEKELEQIQKELLEGVSISREPNYLRIFDARQLTNSSYVEIDLTRQMVYMYYNGECIVETPCVTGCVRTHNETPPGIFYLSYKTRNATLMNNSFVEYWMPFNGHIGLHDASWVRTFGGDVYKNYGSHGCVNLPLEAARTIYLYIDSSMPIIVYNS